MRIAIVSMTQCLPTQDSRVYREAYSLKAAGYDVLIIGLLKKGSQELREQEYKGIKIIRLHMQSGHNDIWILYPLYLLKRIVPQSWQASIRRRLSPIARIILLGKLKRIVFWHRTSGVQQYILSLKFSIQAYKIIEDFGADVVHGHDLPTMPLACWCKWKLGTKVVYDNHELWADRNTSVKPRWLWRGLDRALESFVIRRADAVLAVGDSIAEIMADRYHVPITTLHNYPIPKGTPCSLRERLKILDSQKVILYLGLMTPHRGVEQSIQTLKYLPSYVLVLLGYSLDEAYLHRVFKLISQEGAGEQVYFMSAVPFDEVTSWASSADVALILLEAKCKSYELSFPNKLLESVAAGLPVVVNEQCTEMAGFVRGNQIGKAVNIKDINEISRAIEAVVSNPAYALNSEDLSEEISWHEEVKKLEEIYERF